MLAGSLRQPPPQLSAGAQPPTCSFKQVGAPGDDRPFVFDGDWVDRGAWCGGGPGEERKAGRERWEGRCYLNNRLPTTINRPSFLRGLEIVLLLAAFKVAHRSRVALIRGNHETR